MCADEKEVVQVVSHFYTHIFDSVMRYFQEECSNCAELFSTSEGQVELARMVVVRILAEASYQMYTNDAADGLYDGSLPSEETLRLVVARQGEENGQLDELLDMIYPAICDVNPESGLLPQHTVQQLPEKYDF